MDAVWSPSKTKSTKNQQKNLFAIKDTIVLENTVEHFLKIVDILLLTIQLNAKMDILNQRVDSNVCHVKKAVALVLLKKNV